MCLDSAIYLIDIAGAQVEGPLGQGFEHIDVHFLKPCRYRPDRTFTRHLSRLRHAVNDPDLHLDVLGVDEDGGAPAHNDPKYISYQYRNYVTQYLPHKLAEFLANNYEGAIQVKKAGAEWSVLEYNKILWENVVPREKGNGKHMHLHTFHVLEMESDLCEGIVRAAAAPFPKTGQKARRVCACQCTLLISCCFLPER